LDRLGPAPFFSLPVRHGCVLGNSLSAESAQRVQLRYGVCFHLTCTRKKDERKRKMFFRVPSSGRPIALETIGVTVGQNWLSEALGKERLFFSQGKKIEERSEGERMGGATAGVIGLITQRRNR